MLIDIVARIILLPVLIGQALGTRSRARMLPEPTGERSGVIGQGPPLRLLIIGDSSAAGIGVTTQSEALLGQVIAALQDEFEVKYDLVAESGARTADVLGWLPGLPASSYDVVVTALGVNDVTKGTSLMRFIARQNRLIDYCLDNYGAGLVVVSGMPPVHEFPLLPNPLRWILGRQARRFDRNLRRLVAKKPRAKSLDFDMSLDETNMAIDGFHPGPEVYARWAHHAVTAIKENQALLDLPEPAA